MYDETRKLLDLIELLTWFDEQGYGSAITYTAARAVRDVAIEAAQGTLEDIVLPPAR